ncbi:MAG TPA: alanine racemase, partial [Lachnospiraceae bacterium]|nr:alanine racemase [Lachnospiraceae bacterium]
MSIKRVYAEIDLSAIQSNMEHMNAMIDKHTKIIAVIKADGYGHGALQIAQKFECSEYVFGYATATVEEAVDLRENNIKKPILILGYTFPEDYESIIKYEISPAVFKAETARQLSACAEKMHKKVHVHIKVETGMSRIGVSPDDRGLSVVKEIAACPWIEVEGMFTHFAR